MPSLYRRTYQKFFPYILKCSGTLLSILNNIIHIFTHIFTRTYIKNTQITFLSNSSFKHSLSSQKALFFFFLWVGWMDS